MVRWIGYGKCGAAMFLADEGVTVIITPNVGFADTATIAADIARLFAAAE